MVPASTDALEAAGQNCAQLFWDEQLSSKCCVSATPPTCWSVTQSTRWIFLCSMHLLQKIRLFVGCNERQEGSNKTQTSGQRRYFLQANFCLSLCLLLAKHSNTCVAGDNGAINKCEVGSMTCDVIESWQMVLARMMLRNSHNPLKMKAWKICSLFSFSLDALEHTTSKTGSSGVSFACEEPFSIYRSHLHPPLLLCLQVLHDVKIII